MVVIYANNSQPDADRNNTGANPFESIRQTCTSLFNNFTEKIVGDLQQFQAPHPFKAYPAPAPPSRGTPEAGPSGIQPNVAATAPDSPESLSSFEEIGAVGGQSPDASPDEQWQFLSTNTISSGATATAPTEPPSKRGMPSRRRSDSDVLQDAKNMKIDLENVLREVVEVKKQENACEKCNDAIKLRVADLRVKLEEPTATEDEKHHQLDEFLAFLESDGRRHSIPHSPEERQRCNEFEAAGTATTTATTAATTASSTDSSFPSTSYVDDLMTSTPKIFDRSKRVNLSDIVSIEDFENLSVKQLKEILTLNRVDYRGCCEKEELKERVQRLWRNHLANPVPEQLPAEDLCKICMDAPVEAVFLECGHLVACLNCSKILSECPVCRQYISRIIRFFRV